jgi:hypothetical protein
VRAKHHTVFYVYVDTKPNGEVFYVGKGTDHRATTIKRNRWHEHVCKRHPDWTRERVFSGTERECFIKEKELISKYGRRDIGLGSLVNLTDGGEGIAGAVLGAETRRRMSRRMRGNIFAKGKKHSPEARAAKSERSVGRKHSAASLSKMKEIHGSPEMRAKKSAASKGRPQTAEWVAKRMAAVNATKAAKRAAQAANATIQ